jgi:hypothetical protein
VVEVWIKLWQCESFFLLKFKEKKKIIRCGIKFIDLLLAHSFVCGNISINSHVIPQKGNHTWKCLHMFYRVTHMRVCWANMFEVIEKKKCYRTSSLSLLDYLRKEEKFDDKIRERQTIFFFMVKGYSQWIFSEILFETLGGTALLAMHKYDPISLRAIFVNFKTSPRKDVTDK